MPVIPPEELCGKRLREGTYVRESDGRICCTEHKRRTDQCTVCKLSGSFCACGKRRDKCSKCPPAPPKTYVSEAEILGLVPPEHDAATIEAERLKRQERMKRKREAASSSAGPSDAAAAE
jgi:hypothetical protein